MNITNETQTGNSDLNLKPGRISKSSFLAAAQCSRLGWFAINARHHVPPPDKEMLALFQQGHDLECLARQMFPDGTLIAPGNSDVDQVVSETTAALKTGRPLFEAGFCYGGTFARADILVASGHDCWDLLEVKGVTSIGEPQLLDLAFQARTITGFGHKLRRCFLVYLNKNYSRNGSLDLDALFVRQDCTQQIRELNTAIEHLLDDLAGIQKLTHPPSVPIGPHCSDPVVCPLYEQCWGSLPEHNVTELYSGKRKGFELLTKGIKKIIDIPVDRHLTDRQEIQRSCITSGQPHISKPAIGAFLESLIYPVHYLDFETIATPVPLFDGVKPFQQIPFQYSLHKVFSKGFEPESHAFLAEGATDPRRALLNSLRAAIGSEGSLVAYNSPFEQTRLRECAEAFPEFAAWIQSLGPRFIDLLQPFRAFRFYDPRQRGSCSLKAVMPILTGQGYDHLAIRNGASASQEFLRITFGEVPEPERQAVRTRLLAYCSQDTIGMVRIVEALGKLVSE